MFFLVEEDEVLIVRVLHKSMQPERRIRSREEQLLPAKTLERFHGY